MYGVHLVPSRTTKQDIAVTLLKAGAARISMNGPNDTLHNPMNSVNVRAKTEADGC